MTVYQIIENHLRSLTVDIDGIFINASLPCNMSEISMLSPDPVPRSLGVLVLAVVVGIAWTQSAPQLVNYQGRLTNAAGQPLADGTTVDLTFAFYGVESGGTSYLTVLQEDVVVTGGIYNLLIGSGTVTPGTEPSLSAVFQNHQDVWMGVKVDADAEMTPRARILLLTIEMGGVVLYFTAW